MKTILLIILSSLVLSCQHLPAQKLFSYDQVRPSYNPSLKIREEPEEQETALAPFDHDLRDSIAAYVDSAARIFKERPVYIRGYSVMIYNGMDLEKAKKLRSKVLAQFPDQQAFLDYEPPNAKLKVGQFTRKLYAQQLKIAIEEKGFHGLIIVPEKIKIRDSESEK